MPAVVVVVQVVVVSGAPGVNVEPAALLVLGIVSVTTVPIGAATKPRPSPLST